MLMDILRTSAAKWTAISFTVLCALGYIGPRKPSFYCDDVSLTSAFTGDTIDLSVLLLSIVFGPLLVFALVERFHQKDCYYKQCKTVNSDYLLGLLYVITLVEAGKSLLGELRPHFLETCKPDWKAINCSAGLVTTYKCTGSGPDWLVNRDVFKSFPSGHAAISFYCFVFVYMYSKVRIQSLKDMRLLRFCIEFLFLAWAFICSISRLTDNRHHWWDVLIGGIMGVICGLVTVQVMVRNKFIPKIETNSESNQNSKGNL